jgi:hypothetical protein
VSNEGGEGLGPEWLAYRFDEATNEIHFVDYDRKIRGESAFLAVNNLPERPFRAEPRPRALELAPPSAPIHFVFHSGFCCSTLFTRCFDQPGLATGLSEPNILNDISGWRKRGAAPGEVGRALNDALNLLARPFTGDQAAILKPSTVTNGLAAAMMKLQPQSRAVLMYAPLTDHLTSLAKKGFDGRLWGRQLFLSMRRERLLERIEFTDVEFLGLMDLQIAACAWLGQQQLFADLIGLFPDRVRSLESNAFLAAPEKCVEEGAAFFGLSLSSEQLDAVTTDILARNSKDGKTFGRGDRDADYVSARATYGDEVKKVVTWAEMVAQTASIPLPLAQPIA